LIWRFFGAIVLLLRPAQAGKIGTYSPEGPSVAQPECNTVMKVFS
jgi:hypothetical protein